MPGRGVMKKNLRRILQIADGGCDISTYVDVTIFGSNESGEGSKGSESCLVAARHYFECDTPVEMRRAAPRQRCGRETEKTLRRLVPFFNDDDNAALERRQRRRGSLAPFAKRDKRRRYPSRNIDGNDFSSTAFDDAKKIVMRRDRSEWRTIWFYLRYIFRSKRVGRISSFHRSIHSIYLYRLLGHNTAYSDTPL